MKPQTKKECRENYGYFMVAALQCLGFRDGKCRAGLCNKRVQTLFSQQHFANARLGSAVLSRLDPPTRRLSKTTDPCASALCMGARKKV